MLQPTSDLQGEAKDYATNSGTYRDMFELIHRRTLSRTCKGSVSSSLVHRVPLWYIYIFSGNIQIGNLNMLWYVSGLVCFLFTTICVPDELLGPVARLRPDSLASKDKFIGRRSCRVEWSVKAVGIIESLPPDIWHAQNVIMESSI
jgi:hypothetical protein